MTRQTRQSHRRVGASIAEFVLVVPVFFLLFFGVVEYARFLFTVQLMNNAAREGARYAVVNTNMANTTNAAMTTNVQTYVNNYLTAQGADQLVSFNATSDITVYEASSTTGANTGLAWQANGWGTTIGVSISGTYQPILPGVLHITGSISLQSSCVMTTEAN